MRTLLEFLPEIQRLGHRECIRYNNGFRTWKVSYGELYRRIGGFTRYLDERGLRRGDRIMIWGENRPEWAVAFWGGLARGLEVVPVDYRSSAGLVERIRRETGSKLLLTGQTVDVDALANLGFETLRFEQMRDIEPADTFEIVEASPQDVVQIVYTSGTTGQPKGIVHRHRNIAANLTPFHREIAKYRKYTRPFQPLRILDLLPLSHMFGQSLGLFIPVMLEGSAVFILELHPGAIMENIRRERASVLAVVPRVLKNLRREVERRFDVDGWQPSLKGVVPGALERWWHHRHVHAAFGWKFWAFVVGGAALPKEEEEFWWKLGFPVVQGYGLTEASPVVAVNHPLHPRRGSLGRALEGQEVKIAPDGEILVRGESVVSELTGGAGEEVESNGWLHTGDVGRMDEEGRLYYLGRKKDVIVTSEGLNVHPQDVEAVLNELPGIRESAVVGLPDNGEEQVHAALILGDSSADPEELVREANRKLESHQRIRSWTVWPDEDFPRTSSTLKLKRREILKHVRGIETGKPEESARPTSLVGILSSLSKRPPSEIRDDSLLSEDLGLSSLDRIDLLSGLEETYGVDLDEAALADVATVGELKRHLEERGTGVAPPAGREEPERLETLPRSKGRKPSDVAPGPSTTPRWSRSVPARWFRRAVHRLVTLPLWNRYEQIRVEGIDNLEKVEPPVLFAANHESHLDTVAVLVGLPAMWRRRLAPAMAQEHFRNHFSGQGPLSKRWWQTFQYYLAVILFNAYPLPRQMAGVRSALRFTGELMEAGCCPLVYPEGLRSPDGELQPFKPGIGLMAVKLRVPVVPICLEGMFEIFSVHDSWPRKGSVLMKVGVPLRFEEERDYGEAAQEVREAIERLKG